MDSTGCVFREVLRITYENGKLKNIYARIICENVEIKYCVIFMSLFKVFHLAWAKPEPYIWSYPFSWPVVLWAVISPWELKLSLF